MTLHATHRMLERLIPPLLSLREGALQLENSLAAELDEVEPAYRNSARNLLHYLSVRQHDVRNLQRDLASLGLSSLGVLEAHTLYTLNAVLSLLEQLTGKPGNPIPEPPVDFRTGPLLLRDHTRALLGPDPVNRSVRIMVTMPSEAARDPQLIQNLLTAGMDVMRINCAHDSPDDWKAMVDNLRRAERVVGRTCKVQADLGGPKLRTGPIMALGQMRRTRPQRDALGRTVTPGQLWLTPTENPQPAPDEVESVLPISQELLALSRVGDELRMQDSRDRHRRLSIILAIGDSRVAQIDRTVYAPGGGLVQLYRDEEFIGEGTIGPLPEVSAPLNLFPGETLILTRADEPGHDAERDDAGQVITPAQIHCTLETAFDHAKAGESVWFDDGKIGGIVKANDGERITVQITHTGPSGAKLRAEKGINFPDTELRMSALTDKDIADLAHVVKYVDMVALSFLRNAEDVLILEDHLHRLGGGHLGIVLKIENRQAFENLPRILLASLRSPPVGVMVARGDLAVEMGFDRLSEVQEEILWLCEAAHVPVIWATQMLEGLVKRGSPSRAEITDAAMSSRAECAMLNKGPYIVETVNFLSGILARMDTHQYKRKVMLRKLHVSEL
ncbi:MAG: pyruvate kinase [Gammaproteobacteria bacterium]|nr:pyruvate kinase [Gammaproteobacteria bacterium]